jgi:hypothetical protein
MNMRLVRVNGKNNMKTAIMLGAFYKDLLSGINMAKLMQ